MSPISSSSASTAMAYEAAMLRKVKEQSQLEGEAMISLVQSAATSAPPDGTGTLVDDVA